MYRRATPRTPTTRVGFAKVDITPPVDVELGGFGPFLRRRATAIRAPIWVRAIALECGGARWVLASCDLLGIDAPTADRASRRVARTSGLPRSAICVHATHNHSGPAVLPGFIGWGAVDGLYYSLLPEHIALACRRALEDLAPATVSSARVALPAFSFNRVLYAQPVPNEVMTAGPNSIEIPTDNLDEHVHVIRVDRVGGEPGFLVHYACHPVICCQRTSEVHGDFPGMAIAALEDQEPGTFGLFVQGAMGDINPLYAHGPAEQSYDALDLFAGRLNAAVRRALDIATPEPTAAATSALNDVATMSRVPSRDELQSDLEEHRETLCRAAEAGDESQGAMASVLAQARERMLFTLDAGEQPSRPVIVQSLRLGGLTFTGFDLELFHGLQRAHCARNGKTALLMSTSNGYSGYGPTRAAFNAPGGHYATELVPQYVGRHPFTPDIEEELLDGADRAVASLSGASHLRKPR